MKAYWDSSALVESTIDLPLRLRLKTERGFSRAHTLAECFSALTAGSLSVRLNADDAAKVVEQLAGDLDFVTLTPHDMLQAMKRAKKLGVRGGRIHDLMHAVAASKSGAQEMLTTDQNDFNGLTQLTISQV